MSAPLKNKIKTIFPLLIFMIWCACVLCVYVCMCVFRGGQYQRGRLIESIDRHTAFTAAIYCLGIII